MKRFLGLLAALLICGPAFAAPAAYVTQPTGTYTEAVNDAIANVNAALPSAQSVVSCTGTTTSTCQGTNIQVSITGLTTADAGVVSAAMTVTDASVTAGSAVFCQVMGYAGTGVPYDAVVIPGAGSFTFVIQNNSASAALNATVVSRCMIYN